MPNIQFTYATLSDALQKWPENDNTGFVADMPTMIGLGELRLVRDLNLEIFDLEDSSVSFAIGNRLVNKPVNAIDVRSIGYLDPVNGYTPLKRRSRDYLKHYAPLVSSQAAPEYYVEYSKDQIYVAPTPSSVMSLVYHFVARPTDLLSPLTPNATSWLSTRVPDALFAACLMEGDHRMQADDRYEDFKKKYYEELLPSARFELRALQRSGDYTPFEPTARSK